MLNERILASLPNSGPTVLGSSVDCQLIQWSEGQLEAEQSILWEFLYLPETISYSVRVEYAELSGLSQHVPHQQYQNTGGRTLTLANLRLDGWWRGKVVQPLTEGLLALTRVTKDEHPPILSFVLAGRTVIAPCVLTSIDITETAWAASGEATVATATLTLVETHLDAIESAQTPAIPTLANTSDGRPILTLTERQQVEAEGEATTWLNANLTALDPVIQSVLNTQDFQFSVDSTLGDVSLLDASQGLLGQVGRWDGRNFKTYTDLLAE